MKRAALVGVGTLAGIAAIVTLNPEAATTTAAAAGATNGTATGGTASGSAGSSTGTGSTPVGSSSNGSSSGSSSSSGTGSAKDGSYTGTAVDVGRGYGTIQVQATVSGGRIVDITALTVPQNDPRSAQISSYAVPNLVQQAISAQSASIAGISGATYTSTGFAESLRAALVQAGLAS